MSKSSPEPAASPRTYRNPRLLRNWLSLSGVILSVSAVFAFVLLFGIDIFAKHANPYMGILAYVVAPSSSSPESD